MVLNLKSNSSSNPMTAPALTITMTDLESMADPDLYDMTTVLRIRTSCLFLMMMTGLRVKKQLRWTKEQHIRMPNWAVSGSLIMLLSSIKIQHREIIKN